MQNSVWASADLFKWVQSIDKAKAVTATRATVAAIILVRLVLAIIGSLHLELFLDQ